MSYAGAPWLEPRSDRIESFPLIDVNELRRVGIIPGPEVDGWGVAPGTGRLRVAVEFASEESTLMLIADGLPRSRVQLTWTPCPFGGARAWLRCPCCGARRVQLHLRRARWSCRSCHGLRYETQRLRRRERQLLKARRLRSQLGQGPSRLLAPLPARPKFTHASTYAALERRVLDAELAYLSRS